MDIHILIPPWLLWVIGIPCGIVVALCAGIGAWFLWAFRNWSPLG